MTRPGNGKLVGMIALCVALGVAVSSDSLRAAIQVDQVKGQLEDLTVKGYLRIEGTNATTPGTLTINGVSIEDLIKAEVEKQSLKVTSLVLPAGIAGLPPDSGPSQIKQWYRRNGYMNLETQYWYRVPPGCSVKAAWGAVKSPDNTQPLWNFVCSTTDRQIVVTPIRFRAATPGQAPAEYVRAVEGDFEIWVLYSGESPK